MRCQVHDREHGVLGAASEMRADLDPDRAAVVVRPLRERPSLRALASKATSMLATEPRQELEPARAVLRHDPTTRHPTVTVSARSAVICARS